MLSAIGENRLMPAAEVDAVLINTKTGYARPNRSWILSRLLRDLEHWLPPPCKQAESDKLRELHEVNQSKPEGVRKPQTAIRVGLRATVWQCHHATGKGGHDFVYWSGTLVVLVQLLAFGLPPVLLYDEYFTILVTACGTVLAWASGALPQWTEEKIGVRHLDPGKKKDLLLTEGQGSHDIVMLRTAGHHDLDLEALAASQRSLRHQRMTRVTSVLLAVFWVALLVTVAGWRHHTWYILGVGIVGIVHNVFVAGCVRLPTALGIPVKPESIFVNDKVMKVLWELETAYPRAGASAVETFFPGGFEALRDAERVAWRFANDRYEAWKLVGQPRDKAGMPVEAWPMPDPSWIDETSPNLNIFHQPD